MEREKRARFRPKDISNKLNSDLDDILSDDAGYLADEITIKLVKKAFAQLIEKYVKNVEDYTGRDLQGCEICERYADIELMYAVGDDGFYCCQICYIDGGNAIECKCTPTQSIH